MSLVTVVKARDDIDLDDLLFRSPNRNVDGAGEILRQWFRSSDEVWIGKVDDKIACAFGIVAPSFISNEAYLWLIHTDLVEAHKFLFIRHSQLFIEGLLRDWSMIKGHVAVGNSSGRRWLEWLGAEFFPNLSLDNNFVPFSIRKKVKWPIRSVSDL